jgi:hypothetical protein
MERHWVVRSLLPLRPFFRSLADKIEQAMKKARYPIWTKGLLLKEPNLCQGIVGNVLDLPGDP